MDQANQAFGLGGETRIVPNLCKYKRKICWTQSIRDADDFIVERWTKIQVFILITRLKRMINHTNCN